MSSMAGSPAASRRSATKRPDAQLRRARPLLGTIVSIRIDGLKEDEANRVAERGFAEIAGIHALMSFHEFESDVSRLNREANTTAIAVDRRTFEVIRTAIEIADASGGVFDPTIAPDLVARGFLPIPEHAPAADPAAKWRDIELTAPDRVRFHKPLWIDLGGIAKGYAVDRAIEAMQLDPDVQCCVNAGGDLAVRGPRAERVLVRTDRSEGTWVPAIEIENGSLASSSGRAQSHVDNQVRVGPHVDGSNHCSVGLTSFAAVAAEHCTIADALTKVVLAREGDAAPVLQRFGATAYLQDAHGNWRTLKGVG
ncbi:MAG TPA: FAD:protein FMN transferase [Methylovirgula sp.]|nr:FAD:protein FMN transferase [Methylovirgula sp.]